MTAWHGSTDLKEEAVALMQRHRAQDEFRLGNYVKANSEMASGFQGCFHGCLTAEKIAAEFGIFPGQLTMHLGEEWWSETERIWGIPVALNRLLDDLFECAPDYGTGAMFATSTVEAIPVGADLSRINDLWTYDALVVSPFSPIGLALTQEARTLLEAATSRIASRLQGNQVPHDEVLFQRAAAAMREAEARTSWADDDDAVNNCLTHEIVCAITSRDVINDYQSVARSLSEMWKWHASPEQYAQVAGQTWWGWSVNNLLSHLAKAPVLTSVS